MPSKTSDESIEALTARFRKLDTERTRVNTLLEQAKTTLESLYLEAEEKFGTRDVGELEQRLEKLEVENEKMLSQYKSQLDSIEEGLGKIDEEFDDQEPVR